MDGEKLSNKRIVREFKKVMKLKYDPLGVYFSNDLPEGKIRFQGKILNRCIVHHVFKAAKKGGSSVLIEGKGCPGGQFWSGFRKAAPRGWIHFITHGNPDFLGGRAEHFKKDIKLAAKILKEPGPVKKPEDTQYIIYENLKTIENNQNLEFIVFFVIPNEMAKLISLLNYGRHASFAVKAAAGSGCMSVLNYPLLLKEKPIVDGVMGIWDPFARRSIPKHILTLALKRWIVEEMAMNMSESFVAHHAPFTPKGEFIRFCRKKILRK